MTLLFYLIPIIIVGLIFLFGFANVQKINIKPQPIAEFEKRNLLRKDIYELPGVKQQSTHPLGAVQSVIRGRIRFVLFGLLLILLAVFAFYMLYMTDIEFYFERTTLNVFLVQICF